DGEGPHGVVVLQPGEFRPDLGIPDPCCTICAGRDHLSPISTEGHGSDTISMPKHNDFAARVALYYSSRPIFTTRHGSSPVVTKRHRPYGRAWVESGHQALALDGPELGPALGSGDHQPLVWAEGRAPDATLVQENCPLPSGADVPDSSRSIFARGQHMA